MVSEHGHVDVFENLAADDTQKAIRKFDQIVSLAAGMPAAEDIGEGEGGGKLFGFDEKTSAIGNPGSRFHKMTDHSSLFGSNDD